MSVKQQVSLWYTVRQWCLDNQKYNLLGLAEERIHDYDTYEFRYGRRDI